jgi:hypothetical protein
LIEEGDCVLIDGVLQKQVDGEDGDNDWLIIGSSSIEKGLPGADGGEESASRGIDSWRLKAFDAREYTLEDRLKCGDIGGSGGRGLEQFDPLILIGFWNPGRR